MIERSQYHMLMHSLTHMLFHAKNPAEFGEALETMIRASYEINTDDGRCESIDVTGDVIESMGRHWQAITNIGLIGIEFLRFTIDDDLVFEGGRMEAVNDEADQAKLLDLPTEVLRSFAKAVTISMRKHNVQVLQRIIEGNLKGSDFNDCNGSMNEGLAELIKEFLAEEIEETVAKFNDQLDAVFGTTSRWSPPGGDSHDLPPPE